MIDDAADVGFKDRGRLQEFLATLRSGLPFRYARVILAFSSASRRSVSRLSSASAALWSFSTISACSCLLSFMFSRKPTAPPIRSQSRHCCVYVEISLPQRGDGADKAAEWPCDRAGDQQPGEEPGPDNTCNRGDDDQLDRKVFTFLCLVCGMGREVDDFIDKGFEFVVELFFLCRDFFNHIDRGDRFVRFEQQESFNGMLFVTCVMIFYRFKRGQNVREFF
jgi:hypothetical protein